MPAESEGTLVRKSKVVAILTILTQVFMWNRWVFIELVSLEINIVIQRKGVTVKMTRKKGNLIYIKSHTI